MLDFAIFSDLGDREQNEDAVGFSKHGDAHCFVLCDGLGGHGRGEVASQFVQQSVCRQFEQADTTAEFWENALDNAQKGLLAEQKRLNAITEMMTTAVALTIDGDTAQWAHIGDSRLYVFRREKLLTRTLDHSVPQMLALAGEIREKHIRSHPDRNQLLRAMGFPWESRKYELSEPCALRPGDAFLLCTDGFWEPVLEKEMQKALKKAPSAQAWLDTLQALAIQHGTPGEMDNFSAIAVICP